MQGLNNSNNKLPINLTVESSDMIKVKNLNFTYPNSDTPTLTGLSFEIAKAEIVGFLGHLVLANPPRRIFLLAC